MGEALIKRRFIESAPPITEYYYLENGRISNGTNHTLLVADFNEPLTPGVTYNIDFKNTSGGNVVGSATFTFSDGMTQVVAGGGTIGNITLKININKITTTTYSGPWQDVFVDVYKEPPIPEGLVQGGYYTFAGYRWVVAELLNDYAVLQCMTTVTSGHWPGYEMPQWGNGSTYSQSIALQDISNYNADTLSLYNAISSAEYTNVTYGEGLYLLPLETVGTEAYSENLGIPKQYYRDGLKLGTGGSWLGVPSGSYAHIVQTNGNVYAGGASWQNYTIGILPTFNVDLSKINVSGNTITVK